MHDTMRYMSSNFRIIDPFLATPRTPDLTSLPREMQSLVKQVAEQKDQLTAAHYLYNALNQKYRGYRIFTFLRLDRFFITNLSTLWNKQGFLHCNHLNYLFRTILLASKQFLPDSVQAHWTQVWFFSPHQYLSLSLDDGRVVEVDLWGKAYGVPFGSHAHGLRSGHFFPKRI